MDKQYDTVICEGNSVNLSAGGAISYEWTPHAGLDDPFSPNPTATPTNTTTYYLTGYGEACNIIYNGDFSGGYDGFSTAYTYDPDLHPEGNFYIGDNPNDYHSNFAACGDHTTGTGDMMVINGSPVANEEIWCQDIVVLPNTDYVFSTWLTSVHPSNPAILQFSINGSLLGSPFPATATTCDWNQFYATWNSGANTNITICIVNQNTIATGNDFAIDDIYFSPICPSVNADSVKITVNPNPTPVLPVNTAACIHDLPFTIDVGNGYADYAWNTAETTQAIDVNTTGNYSVTVTDGNGCTNETSTSFVVNPVPDVTTVVSSNYSGQDISCFGLTDGSAEVQHNSGTPPYFYLWDVAAGAQTTQEATNLGAGTYFVTITDSNGCTIDNNITLVEPPQLDATTSVTSDYNGENISCNGFTDGSAEVNPTDGTPPYTYLWDAAAGNQTTQEATNLGAGTYFVTVTDDNGCTIERSITLVDPTQLDATTSVTSDYNGEDISCNGFTDGSAEVIPTEGTPPYTYLWDAAAGNQTTQEATNLGAGTYSVTVTDDNGCTIERNITLVEPPQLDATTSVTSDYNGEDISCNGFTDGSAEVNPTDGTPPYTYLWDAAAGNQTTQEATNLGAGTYFVTVTDDNGCTIERSITLVDPTQLDATTSVTSDYNGEDISCNGFTDGSAEVIPTEGTPPYTYLWDAAAGNQTTQEATNLGAGTYFVTVTDDNGCTIERNITLVEPPQLDAITSVTSDYNGENISCNGFTDGSAEVLPTDGTGPYTYLWDAAAGNQTTQEATNLGAGTYSVTVTDDNGCTIERNITLVEPPQLDAITSVTSDYNGEDISCNGFTDGSAEVLPTDGTPPYTYLWDAAAGNQTTQEATNLGAGIYFVTVTDDNGCTIERSITLVDPTQLDATTSVTSDYNGEDISCNGFTDGSAEVVPTDGTAPYTYLWDAAAGNQTTQEAINLGAGTYFVIVTDINGCSVTRDVTLSEPTQLDATISVTSDFNGEDISCNGFTDGSAEVNPTDGTPPYTYLWDAAAGNQTTQEATNLGAGTYFVTVTDDNGCTIERSITLVDPTQLDATTTVTSNYNGEDISCNGFTDGSAEVLPTDGTPPYTYLWDAAAGNQTTQEATNLGAGNYFVTVTDNNGCTIERSIVVSQPAQLNASVNVSSNYHGQHISCNGLSDGSALVSPINGTAPYNYQWDASTGNQISQEANNLSAGNYNVTITDINGCSISRNITLNEPTVLTVNTSSVDVVCGSSLGSVTAHPSGATPGYNYLWSNGIQNQTATGLIVGNYLVTVTDINGCTTIASSSVEPFGNLNITFTLQEPVSCYSYTDAVLLSHVSNGVPQFEYIWSNGDNQSSITNVGEGNYTLTVNDSWGCYGVNNFYIDQPTEIVLNYATNDVLCYGDSNGSATVLAAGGFPPYSYDWINGNNSNMVTDLSAGIYPVSVTDSRACTVVGEAVIQQPDRLTASFQIDSINCFGETGAIKANVAGGTSPYSYLWTSGVYNSSEQLIVNIPEAVYYLNIVDNNSCEFDTLVNMPQPEPLTATYVFDRPSCIGNWDGAIEVILSGGTAPYYSNLGISVDYHIYLDGLYEGLYEFDITDYRGCELYVGPVELIDIQVECLTIPNAFTPNGDGVNDTWQIENIHMYPGAQIQIFNRWGQLLWMGSPSTEWDGTYNNKPVPTGTFIYVINLYNGEEPRIGNVTVVY
jgi:large repetitive protein